MDNEYAAYKNGKTKMIYILHEKAQQECEKAIKWYLKRSLNAAEGFVATVDFALTDIHFHSIQS